MIFYLRILRHEAKRSVHLHFCLSEAMGSLPDDGSSSKYTSGIPEPLPEDEVLPLESLKSFRLYS